MARRPWPSFTELVLNVPIDVIVKVQYKYPTNTRPRAQHRKVSHIVVAGPGVFQLCMCLKLMRCGLHCSHVMAALVTRLGRANEFIGESIHPRWRSSLWEWSLRCTELGDFERAKFTGGYTDDDFEGAADLGEDDGQAALSNSLKNIQGKAYTDWEYTLSLSLHRALIRCRGSRYPGVWGWLVCT